MNMLRRMDSCHPGEQVSIQANMFANGRPYGLLRSLEKEGLLVGEGGLAAVIAAQEGEGETPPATSLAGIWRADITNRRRSSSSGARSSFDTIGLPVSNRDSRHWLDESSQ